MDSISQCPVMCTLQLSPVPSTIAVSAAYDGGKYVNM